MSDLKKAPEVVVSSVALGDLIVIPYVVARIHERRVIDRVEPYRIAAKALYIVKLWNDTVDIAYTVTVAVAEGLGIDLIKNGVP